MTNPIVTVNVSLSTPPAPSLLQRTGAFISQGGTTLAANTLQLITQLSDLTTILAAAKAVTSLTQTSGTATLTTTAAHGWTTGETIEIVVAGATPTAYNGVKQATITGANTMTYAIDSGTTSPATGTITVQLGSEAELLAMGTTFFAQGSQSVYVLELGEGDVAAGVAALTTWLTNNPGTVYSFLVPRTWDADADFLTLIGSYESTTAKTYFHVTTTTGTYTSYTALMKCVLASVEAPSIPVLEFSAAAQFYVTLNYNPSSTNKVPQLAFNFVYGVTPYPTDGTQTLLVSLKAANIGYIGTGAEGGLSTAIILWGKTLDGNSFNYWYSVDWAQINLDSSLANAVINGSNDPIAPLYYNQQGINSLQDVATQTISNAVTYGLALGQVVQTQLSAADFAANYRAGLYRGQCVVNAEPFSVYTAENPNDYAIGKYAGFAAVYTIQNGFQQIIFDLNATQFA